MDLWCRCELREGGRSSGGPIPADGLIPADDRPCGGPPVAYEASCVQVELRMRGACLRPGWVPTSWPWVRLNCGAHLR
jgi:hypothetical protein